MLSPLETSNSRNPLVMEARTTSLNVPPRPLRTFFMSSTEVEAQA